jgi:phosphatidylinositol-4,5-bisphosphate 3-kinase
MVSAGMPELSEEGDIRYLRDMLDLNITEQEATAKFKLEIKNSLATKSRRVDNMIHNIKHG